MFHFSHLILGGQRGQGFRTKPDIGGDTFRCRNIKPRMMCCLFGFHAEIGNKGQHLENGSHDPPPARSTRGDHGLVTLGSNNRAHIGERPFARRQRIGGFRARVEPHHAVIHQHAGFREHHAAAHAGKQCGGHGYHHAVLIRHRQMGGAGFGCFWFRIAKSREALRIGRAQHARQLRIPSGGGRLAGEIRALHPFQHANQRGRGGQAIGQHQPLAAPFGFKCRQHARLAIRQILGADKGAHFLAICGDGGSDIARIEISQPRMGQAFQRGGQIALREEAGRALIGGHRRQAARQINSRRFRIELQHGRRIGHFQRSEPILRQATLRKRHRWRQHILDRHAAMARMQFHIAGHRGWNGEGKRAMHIAVFQHFRPGEQIRLHLACHGVGGRLQAAWGNRAEIKSLGGPTWGHHLREANPAQAAIPGL